MSSRTNPGVETAVLPNSVEAIRTRTEAGLIPRKRVWAMLGVRIGLALSFQTVFALGHWIAGDPSPWRSAADWWLVSFALSEFVNLWLLARCARLEGIRWRDLYNLRRLGRSSDLKWTGLALALAAPLALIPGSIIASALWADPVASQEALFRPIWVPAAWAMLMVFPPIHALTELPTYYGYVMPRLRALTSTAWLPLALTASTLSLQHAFLPLLFDSRYLLWRALMFLPLTFWLGWAIQRRPTALPYIAIAHGLLDLSLPILLLLASRAA